MHHVKLLSILNVINNNDKPDNNQDINNDIIHYTVIMGFRKQEVYMHHVNHLSVLNVINYNDNLDNNQAINNDIIHIRHAVWHKIKL